MLAIVDISGQLAQSFGGGYSSEFSTPCGSQKSHGLGVSVLRGMHVGRRESAAAKASRGVEKAPSIRREKRSKEDKKRWVNFSLAFAAGGPQTNVLANHTNPQQHSALTY